MRHFLLLTLLFFSFTLVAQKVSKDNPTYMNVDHDLISRYVQKDLKGFGRLFFSPDSIPDNAKLVDLKLENAPEIEGLDKLNQLNLFQLDTNRANVKVSWAFYQNPKYLSLNYDNANRLGKKEVELGKITPKLIAKKPNWKGFVKLLIYMGVIGTYDHLNAEMIILGEEDNSEEYKIQFSVVWHYCTNDCFDPTYKFAVVINKNSGVLKLKGK